MEIINSYIKNLTFTKVDNKQGFSIYAAVLNGNLGQDMKQYFLLFVPEHLAISKHAKPDDLPWQNFQSRLIKNGFPSSKLIKQYWSFEQRLPNPIFKSIERNKTSTMYILENAHGLGNSLEMTLLHDHKKKSIYQYNDRMNLLASINTFNCVITISNNPVSNFEESSQSSIGNYNDPHYSEESYLEHSQPVPRYELLNHTPILRSREPYNSTQPLFQRQPVLSRSSNQGNPNFQDAPDFELL